MHGLIFFYIRKYAESLATADGMPFLRSTSIAPSRKYLPSGVYPDEEALDLVRSIAASCGLPVEEVLERFGRFLAPHLLKVAGTLVDPTWKTLDLIEHTEGVIHAMVRSAKPGAAPPVIDCVRLAADELSVVYTSRRRLCRLAVGLMQGLARHFGEELDLDHPSCMHRGDAFCSFTLTTRTDGQQGRSGAIDVRPATVVEPPAAERVGTFPYRPGETVLPGYRLEQRLGSGAFGEVWRATAPGGMSVAIKILPNLGRAQGGREYRALQTIKNIRHAHIVPIFGVWLKSRDGRTLGEAELVEAERQLLASRRATWRADQGIAATVDVDEAAAASDPLDSLELIIAMGLGDQSLRDRLRERLRQGETGIPPETLVDWMHQAALALDHFNSGARRSGGNVAAVQHCDIKPANILLVGDAVQVCDFGLARAEGEVRVTANTMASIAYAAPEMVSGRCDPSPATDQYSLAISYVELRTGRLPYPDLTAAAIIRAKLDGMVDLSSLPDTEAKVIARAVAVDPALRWKSCVEFIRELAVVGAGGYASIRVCFPPATLETAQSLEKASRFADAGEIYTTLYAEQPDALATVLWDLQSQASDANRGGECVPLLRRLERLYAASPPPTVSGITRWDVVNSLAWRLATDPTLGPAAAEESRQWAAEAVGLAEKSGALLPWALDTAAAAAARSGRFDEAVERIERAIALSDDAAATADFRERLEAYRVRRAWSEPL